MDWVFPQNKVEKEFDAISCIIQDIQICLNSGSESISIVENKIQCNYCEERKSICGNKDDER